MAGALDEVGLEGGCLEDGMGLVATAGGFAPGSRVGGMREDLWEGTVEEECVLGAEFGQRRNYTCGEDHIGEVRHR